MVWYDGDMNDDPWKVKEKREQKRIKEELVLQRAKKKGILAQKLDKIPPHIKGVLQILFVYITGPIILVVITVLLRDYYFIIVPVVIILIVYFIVKKIRG